MQRSEDEKTIIVHSAYKVDPLTNNCDFRCHYRGAIHAQDTEHIRVKSVTIPNLFPNVYGDARQLYIAIGAATVVVTVAEGRYETPAALAAAVAAGIGAATTDTTTPTVSADGVVTFTNAATPYTFYSTSEVDTLFGKKVSMNHILGAQVAPYTPNQLAFVMAHPVALNGVRRVYVSSEKLSFARSAHPSGYTGSLLCSVSLHNTPYGYLANFIPPDRENYESWYSNGLDLNQIDIRVTDEYNQTLSLPENQHVEVELVIGSRKNA